MAAATLVDSDIRDGAMLLRQLDEDSFPVTAAYWYYRADRDAWQMMIASPVVDDQGPLEGYRKLTRSMDRLRKHGGGEFGLDSFRIQLVEQNDRLTSLIRRIVKTRHGISGVRLSGNSVDGTFVEDAYVYRMERPRQPAR